MISPQKWPRKWLQQNKRNLANQKKRAERPVFLNLAIVSICFRLFKFVRSDVNIQFWRFIWFAHACQACVGKPNRKQERLYQSHLISHEIF